MVVVNTHHMLRYFGKFVIDELVYRPQDNDIAVLRRGTNDKELLLDWVMKKPQLVQLNPRNQKEQKALERFTKLRCLNLRDFSLLCNGLHIRITKQQIVNDVVRYQLDALRPRKDSEE